MVTAQDCAEGATYPVPAVRGAGLEAAMGEFKTAAQVLGAVTAGYFLLGEQLAGELHSWFGWPVVGPVTWLHGVVGGGF